VGQVSPAWVTFLFEAANFLLLAAVLGWAFFRPIRAALEERRARLEGEERAAAEKLAEAERALAEASARRRELEGSLASLRERMHQEAEQERARLLETAREQAQRERETLKTELAAVRKGQTRRIAGDAAGAAREIVLRLLERIAGPDLQQSLVDAACRELAGLAASGGTLAPLVVESPHALEPAALDSLGRAAGVDPSEVGTRVVADLAVGVRVLTSRGLIDASAAGLAAEAERALTARFDAEASDGG
jgi:F0F1-type ATP synthase membrane subunit b/b'